MWLGYVCSQVVAKCFVPGAIEVSISPPLLALPQSLSSLTFPLSLLFLLLFLLFLLFCFLLFLLFLLPYLLFLLFLLISSSFHRRNIKATQLFLPLLQTSTSHLFPTTRLSAWSVLSSVNLRPFLCCRPLIPPHCWEAHRQIHSRVPRPQTAVRGLDRVFSQRRSPRM